MASSLHKNRQRIILLKEFAMNLFSRSIFRRVGAACLLSVLSATLCLAAEAPRYDDHLKLALVNMQPVWGDKDANLKKMVRMANEAADNGAQMIVFPEMCLTGYAMEQGDMKRADRMQIRLAETETGPSASVMTKLARDRSVYIVYGYPERIGSDKLNVYNSAFVAGPDGYLGSYRKIHPFGSEVIWCKTGTEPFSFDTPWGPMGISICYDTYNYPELGRYYGALGCRMILNPTATSWAYYSNKNLKNGKPLNNGFPTAGNNTEWVNRFKSRVEAVVVQSGLFVASSDLAGAEYDARGTFMGTCFPGGSCVVGPSDDKPGTLTYFDYFGTDPAAFGTEGIAYSNVDLSRATRNSFANYIKTDLQEGNLYMPDLYAKWFGDLAASGKFTSLNHAMSGAAAR